MRPDHTLRARAGATPTPKGRADASARLGRNRRLGLAGNANHQSTTNTDTLRSNMATTSETTNGR
jgi:hypothetical protein